MKFSGCICTERLHLHRNKERKVFSLMHFRDWTTITHAWCTPSAKLTAITVLLVGETYKRGLLPRLPMDCWYRILNCIPRYQLRQSACSYYEQPQYADQYALILDEARAAIAGAAGATRGGAAAPAQTPGGTPVAPTDASAPSGGAHVTPQADAHGAQHWLTVGMHVRCCWRDGITGVVVNVGGDTCTVRQKDGVEASLDRNNAMAIRPDTKLEIVKVLDHEYRGAVGQLLNFERVEAVVKFNAGEAEGGRVRILDRDILVKFDPSVGRGGA